MLQKIDCLNCYKARTPVAEGFIAARDADSRIQCLPHYVIVTLRVCATDGSDAANTSDFKATYVKVDFAQDANEVARARLLNRHM